MREKLAPAAEKGETGCGNVFIIDDDSDIAAMMAAVIRNAGYNVATAFDPVSALQMDLPFKPDIILTDIMMPQMSGFDLIDKIKELCDDHNIRIMAVSALKSPSDIEQAIEAGAADYLAKPFHPEELLLRIERQMHSLRGKITPSKAQSDPAVRQNGIRVGQDRDKKPEEKVIPCENEKPEEDDKTERGSLELEPVELAAGPRLEPSGASILVIDDDPDIRALLKLRLKEIGHRVLLAGDGEQGISIAEREEPDLIILDILMPGMNGYDVARNLAGKPHMADIPVLMLSARGSSRDITQGLNGYADEYVTKPFQLDELLARVGALIRRTHRSTRDKREQRWVIQLLADKALNKSHQIFSRNIEGEKEFPASWKGPTPDLLTKWGNSYQAFLVETVESLQDEKTISRWKAIEEKKNVRLFIVGLSRETARLAKKIKSEREFQAKIMWSRPRSPGESRWKEQNPFARRLMYVAAGVALLASLFLSGVVPNIIDRISGINSGLNRQLSIYQPRDSERSLKTIWEMEKQLKEEKRRVLERP